ncbi:hypothetical protein F5Y18DRAFT_432509 [Xylariaceae sp. FL1019]|nr:hypothetical protein F5Y18DRAFT_432509 [Xylariaceae sp. FL1019]
MTEPLSKVDSAVEGVDGPPKVEVKDRRTSRLSSSANQQPSRKDYYLTKTNLAVAPETQKTGWKVNSNPSTLEDKEIANKPIVSPPIRNLDLKIGEIIVPVRNTAASGVTIHDAMTAIFKKKKKVADEDLKDGPYLKGFEWPILSPGWEQDAEKAANSKGAKLSAEDLEKAIDEEKAKIWGTLIVHTSATAETNVGGGKKKKKQAE